MATMTLPRTATTTAGRGRFGPGRFLRWLREHSVALVAGVALLYLFLPIVVVVLFSFNNPAGRYNFTWQGFTTHNWTNVCGVPGMCSAVTLSLKIGILSTVIATLLGTLIAFAIVRHSFRGRQGSNLLIFLPMATPEVVMGSSLLALFVNANVSLGFGTILAAHILFNISFVVITVKARLQGLDPRLEQAAMDLYANEWQTFRRITFPLVFPGILAAALLAFSLSFDDFIITNFNAGNTTVTFPMFVWGAAQRGIPPQINVIGTMMFAAALVIVLGGTLASRRRAH